ncbi:MAG: PepSY-associated TM helix domain-containing protein [Steroidobacter sp.]
MRAGRQVWVITHRWAGLSLALFLTVVGLTGALMAFYDEIESLIAPQLHIAQPPSAQTEPLDSLELREKVRAAYPGAVINYLPLKSEPGKVIRLDIRRIDPATGRIGPWSPTIDEVFVDPYTGRVIAHRLWGDISQGAVNVMPFIYRLHYTLLADKTGRYILGIAALIWVLDTFIGFYLTLPAWRARQQNSTANNGPSWWSRWKPSWLVRWTGGETKLTFDLHRAGGLWIWPMLFVFAWSSVYFNLREVYDPVMRMFGAEKLLDGVATLARPRHEPQLDFAAATAHGRELAKSEAAQRGLTIEPDGASALSHRPAVGAYVYYFSTDRDFTIRGGRSLVIFDSDSGALKKIMLPQGANGANTFTEWMIALHMARVGGLPYRIAVTLIGLLVTTLSVTGVLIWMRKRQARSLSAEKVNRRRLADSQNALAPSVDSALPLRSE